MYLATRINSFLSDKNKSILDVIRGISTIDGITHLDLNYPEHFQNVQMCEMQQVLEETGLKINGLAVRFRDEFVNGEIGNDDDDIALKAINLCKDAIDVCRQLKGEVVTIWLGYDGFDYSFQIDYLTVWNKLVRAFREVAAYDKDIKVSIEYKPFQPRAFSMIASIGTTLLLVNEAGNENLGVTLDYCHMLMKGENPAYGLSLAAGKNKLYGVHINDGYGLNDDGLMVGSVSFIQSLEFIYYLKKYNYDGVVYFDTFPVRENVMEECRQNVKIYKKLNQLIDSIGLDKIEKIVDKNDGVAAQEILMACLK